ncbi:MAG: GTP 3',8-cyclase MoaA [Omnitrophica WOR_2 bacterium]
MSQLNKPDNRQMLDNYNRSITYLRISVTDRCNLRCQYCMPEEGVTMLPHNEILSFEEICEVVETGAALGITKVRITGGEPLVRRGIVDLISMIGKIEGISDLSMTTNAILLDKYAVALKEAGLHRVNISLDTMDPDRFREITRGGDITDVIKGIDSALFVGLAPIKLNCVVNGRSDTVDANAVREFGKSRDIEVRFIHQMDLSAGHFSVVEGGSGGDCVSCNRLRLTANGKIKPCLFNDREYDVRVLGAKEAILKAVEGKPGCGTHNYTGHFYNIGG